MTTDLFAVAWIFVGAAALMAVWQFMYVPSMAASFRERLFSTRREIFIAIAQERLSFEERGYLDLRALINGLLFSAEQITLGRILWHYALAPILRRGERPSRVMQSIEQTEDKRLRERLEAAYANVMLDLARFLISTSPVGLLAVPVFTVVNLVEQAPDDFWRRLTHLVNRGAAATFGRIGTATNPPRRMVASNRGLQIVAYEAWEVGLSRDEPVEGQRRRDHLGAVASH